MALYRVVILAVIDVIALFGNILVCLSVYKNPRLRSKIGTVILVLASTDLLTALVIIPLSIASLILGEKNIDFRPKWVSSNKTDVWCGIQGFLLYSLLGVSLFSMTLAAFIRYLCVVKPNFYHRNITIKTIIVTLMSMVVVIMLLQASIAIPGYAEYQFVWEFGLCMLLFQYQYKAATKVIEPIIVTVFIGLPLVAIFLFYTAIFFTVRKHNRTVNLKGTNNEQLSTNENLKGNEGKSHKWKTSFFLNSRKSKSLCNIKRGENPPKNEQSVKDSKENSIEIKEKNKSEIIITIGEYDKKMQENEENNELVQDIEEPLQEQIEFNKTNNVIRSRNNSQEVLKNKAIRGSEMKENFKVPKETIPELKLNYELDTRCTQTTDVQTKNNTMPSSLHTGISIPYTKTKTGDIVPYSNRYSGDSISHSVPHSSLETRDALPCSNLDTRDSVKHSSLETRNAVSCSSPRNRDSVKHSSPRDNRDSDTHSITRNRDLVQLTTTTVKNQVTEAKVTKTVLAVFLGFICCWIPAGVTLAFINNTKNYEYNGVVASLCCALSSAVNPFIYGATDRRFRQTYKKVLKCERICSFALRLKDNITQRFSNQNPACA